MRYFVQDCAEAGTRNINLNLLLNVVLLIIKDRHAMSHN